MNEHYLWDRSGPPDPEIVRLERTLAPLRFRPRQRRGKRGPAVLAVAAAILIAVVVGMRPRPELISSWKIAGRPLRAGQALRTGAEDRITLEADAVGEIEIGPESEMRARTDRHLFLHRGTMHALIWAPPRQFVVDTPSVRAVDMGCEYTLETDASGNGLLRVQRGWVAFQSARKDTFIPAGAVCRTRQSGPGIPVYSDAPAPLRTALDRWEAGEGAALGALLAAARPRDAFTVWHLLTRVPESDRSSVLDRFEGLVSMTGVRRESILRLEPGAIDSCWNALHLESTDWWRGWQRNW